MNDYQKRLAKINSLKAKLYSRRRKLQLLENELNQEYCLKTYGRVGDHLIARVLNSQERIVEITGFEFGICFSNPICIVKYKSESGTEVDTFVHSEDVIKRMEVSHA